MLTRCHFCSLVYFLERIKNFTLPCLICLQTISLSNYAGFMNISNMTRVHILSLLLFTCLESCHTPARSSISTCGPFNISRFLATVLLFLHKVRQLSIIDNYNIIYVLLLFWTWNGNILSIPLISINTLIFPLILIILHHW